MGERSSTSPFDTQRAVEELVAAGMPPDQAGVIVRLHLRWADRDLATGKDIDRLCAETDRLREIMELKFEVIEQRIDARYESLDRKIDERYASLDHKIDERYASLDHKIDERYASLDHKIDARCSALETKIAQSSAATIKWVTTSQIGTAAVYLAALLAAIKF
ncbi:MAG: hypothetical protein OYH76_07110 [Defluviicoccus sp.]|nr:hypothetical protein [Defluviicoccus sp.]MDE0275647.1 hypothetical protein [Defluviicoccus sp.]